MNRTASVNDLLQGFSLPAANDTQIKGLSLDSGQVKDDYAFVALQGIRTHGIEYQDAALKLGANCIIYENVPELEFNQRKDTAYFKVDDLSKNLSRIAARFYQNPSEKLKVFAITGTNGKSSIAYGLYDLLDSLGYKTTVVGTVGTAIGSGLQNASHTTPDAISLQALIFAAVKAQSKFLVMEASSHGLAQYRLDGVKVDIVIYTNLSRDHQDFHADMRDYARAKERLMQFPTVKIALINVKDEVGSSWYKKYKSKLRVIAYGINIKTADYDEYLNATDIKLKADGLEFKLESSWGEMEVKAPVFGRFNIENLLAIIGSALLLDLEPGKIVKKIAKLNLVPGRMQSIKCKNKPLAIVDYAHTPDALAKALRAIREHVGNNGKIFCVFGCGGDRDRGKRPLMGAAVELHADIAIITDDNPRFESSEKIINDILAGFENKDKVLVIPGRKAAIKKALAMAAKNDVVLVAGKGHETTQIIKKKTYEFNDARIIEELLC